MARGARVALRSETSRELDSEGRLVILLAVWAGERLVLVAVVSPHHA